MKKIAVVGKIVIVSLMLVSVSVSHAEEHDSYQRNVIDKAGNGFANIATGWLEIPKNIINTTNKGNFILGFFGGLAKGIVNMAGRTGAGIADLVTFPIPSQPIVQPTVIWDDFDVDSTYGQSFRQPKD